MRIAVAVPMVVVLAIGAAGWAYFTSTGSGTGAACDGTLCSHQL